MKLVLVDGHAILHRAFHALPPLTDKSGNLINAVYGLVSMLLRVIQELGPTHIIVCFDEAKPTFRKKEFAKYQSHRPKTDDGLVSQFTKARDVVTALGIPVYSKGGYEADDLLGTIAKKAKTKGDVVIITGDRDILQLVDEKVKVYMPVLGMSQGKLYGKAEVWERMGVIPEQIIDYKALVGDPSDNYPGVAGIGPKTAITLIEKYKNLKEIYKNLKEISPRVREKLEKNKDMAEISLKLATIITNVPFKFDLEKADKWDVDSPRVLELFATFGFKTLTQRVKKVGEEQDKNRQMTLI
jgi:DNA polymerase-1